MTGNLFLFIGPSGAGKTTIVDGVLNQYNGTGRVITYTTRDKRPGEQNGVDYHFISRGTFELMIEDGLFVEYNEHHGNLYGTSKAGIKSKLESGVDVLLIIDYVGAKNVLKYFPNGVSFFITADREQLKERLIDRGDTLDSIDLRLSRFDEETLEAENFDYFLVNNSLDRSIQYVIDIIEHHSVFENKESIMY